MIFLIFYFFLLSSDNVHGECTNSTFPISCAFMNPTTRYINIPWIVSNENCIGVTVESITYVYDPVTINYAWITLENPGTSCSPTIRSIISTLTTTYITSSNQEIIVLSVTAAYYRFIVVPNKCTNCNVTSMSSTLEKATIATGLKLYPIYNNLNVLGPYCLNNGYIDKTYTGAGYKCICNALSSFMGPSCELMERVINTTQYFFNIYPSGTSINMAFSFFSNGITGNVTLLSIQDQTFKKIIIIIIIESKVTFYADGITTTLDIALDNQSWFDFNIIITRQTATLTINGPQSMHQQPINMASTAIADFRSYYLIIYAPPLNTIRISLKNLVIDSNIIDFNTYGYVSSCNDRCSCTSNQRCDCKPFISVERPICSCKFGYQPNGSDCSASLSFAQMPSSVPSSIPSLIPMTATLLSRLDFGFQTLSVNGNLLTLNLSTTSMQIGIQIINTNLTLNIQNSRMGTINYNVSNGFKHTVTLNINTGVIQMILDDNLNYSTTFVNWIDISLYPSMTSITLANMTLGVLQPPFTSQLNNLSTCFSSIQLNGNSINTLSSQVRNMLLSCSSGPRCASNNVKCPINQICDDTQWQNTKCICSTNYSFVNATYCVPTICLNNPCGNVGCIYNSISNTYTCPTTSVAVSVSTGGLWWIAVLIVLFLLLLLLIILLVYCCCCHKSSPAVMVIGKVNENAAVYNEQAGEADYDGPPINFNMLKNALNSKAPSTITGTLKPTIDFESTKENIERHNDDLILDYPLEYGYEGYDSDNVSISAIGSIGGDTQVDDVYDINQYLDQN